MINMMYLVLTALLALNVSRQILEAFDSLRQSLEKSAIKYVDKNVDTKNQIIAKIDEEEGQNNFKNLDSARPRQPARSTEKAYSTGGLHPQTPRSVATGTRHCIGSTHPVSGDFGTCAAFA